MGVPELERLVELGQLRRMRSTPRELPHLLETGLARLHDARNTDLAEASRFDLAYNASHALALAALRLAGYRSKNRFVVFQALEHTAGLAAAQWRVLAKAHETRNLFEYEGHGEIDPRLLHAVILVAQELGARLETLLRNSGTRGSS